MAHGYPDTPEFMGLNTPIRTESHSSDLVVEGILPPELNGAFFRAVPDPAFPPRYPADTAISGDGMISRFLFKGGRVEYRDDRKGGNVQVPIGKASFTRQQLLENFRAVIDELNRAKPASAKGRYLKKIAVSSTMGPGVRIDTNRLRPDLTTTGG